ncbi:hypothetical protein OG589_35240 [Sphaerisporangium sp. NBC_01403]|uniref:hypothetical protein n=1 Tax=Sphaerisporangium sp. NBC_01403 TaxID=2903599 RepID=UPI0032542BC6
MRSRTSTIGFVSSIGTPASRNCRRPYVTHVADVDDARIPEIAGQWAEIEEFTTYGFVDREYLLTVAKELVGLARRAKDNDQLLYCWPCP